jgi:hypothetical protein
MLFGRHLPERGSESIAPWVEELAAKHRDGLTGEFHPIAGHCDPHLAAARRRLVGDEGVLS